MTHQILLAQDWLIIYNFINKARKHESVKPLTSDEMVNHLIYLTNTYEINFIKNLISNYKNFSNGK